MYKIFKKSIVIILVASLILPQIAAPIFANENEAKLTVPDSAAKEISGRELAYQNMIDVIVEGKSSYADISMGNFQLPYEIEQIYNDLNKRIPWLMVNIDKYKITYMTEGAYGSQIRFDVGDYSNVARAQLHMNLQKELRMFLDVVEPGMSDIEKTTALYDRFVSRVQYDLNAKYDKTHTMAQAAILSHTAKCYEYDILYGIFCNMVGIEAMPVPGYLSQSPDIMGHAWPFVKVDGQWYTADPTWDGRNYAFGGMAHDSFIANSVDILKKHGDFIDEDLAIKDLGITNDSPYTDMLVTGRDTYHHYSEGYWYYIKDGNKLYKSKWTNDKVNDPKKEIFVKTLNFKSTDVIKKYFPLSFTFHRDRLYYYNFDNESIETIKLDGSDHRVVKENITTGTVTSISVYDDEIMYRCGTSSERYFTDLEEDLQTSFFDRDWQSADKNMLQILINIAKMDRDFFKAGNDRLQFPESEYNKFSSAISHAEEVYKNGSKGTIPTAYKNLQEACKTYDASINVEGNMIKT